MRLLRLMGGSSPFSTDLGLLIVRAAFGLSMALVHGWGKITDISGFSAKIAKRVILPELLGPAAALSEFVGALLIAAGLFTRGAATFLCVTMGVAAFFIHADDPFSRKEKALAYFVVSLAILVAGPGRFSLDAKLIGRERRDG